MAETTWADAVAQLAAARTKAETSVAILKKFGDSVGIARGQLIYSDAKAEADAVIAGLIVALSEKGQPEKLSSLQERVERIRNRPRQASQSGRKAAPQIGGLEGIQRHLEGRDRAVAETAAGCGGGSLQQFPDGQ